MFLNIQTQFYSTYCPVIQSESYKSVQVESKSLFYSFPYGLPSTQLVIAARPLLPPTPMTTPWNCSVLRSTPLSSLSHGLHSLGTESTSRPLTVPFQREGTSWSHAFPILASTPVSSHLPFLPHLIDKTPPWTTVLICFLSSCTPAKEPHTCWGHGTFRVSDLKP